MLYTVYHVQLDSDLVNSEGWEAAPHYLGMTTPSFEKAEAYTNKLIGDPNMALDGILEPVAVVDADEISDVFRLTNHIDSDWTKNEEVEMWSGVDTARSTSVGDVLVDERGKAYRVSSFGYRWLTEKHFLTFTQSAGEAI